MGQRRRARDWPVTVPDARVWKLYKSRLILDQSAIREAAASFLNVVSKFNQAGPRRFKVGMLVDGTKDESNKDGAREAGAGGWEARGTTGIPTDEY